MDDPSVLALCAGVGGLEMGVRRAVGGRVVGYVERDAYAASVLLARVEDQALDPAPVWCGNLEDLDPAPFRGVDIVTAGFPCQPFSIAGKRRGLEDERWLWPSIAALLGEIQPGWVFLENVPGLVRHGLGPVLRDLSSLGFDAEWGLFRASDVGAPFEGERWFCLAQAHGEGLEGVHPPYRRVDLQPVEGDVRGHWDSEPEVDRVADGVRGRVDRLRCLGNAVVPAQAELAFRELLGRYVE